jgi:hypothetical protein
VWQVPQLAVVAMWLAALPVASVPLWQLEQFVAALKVLWSTRAPSQLLVLWQVTQFAVVGTWTVGLPEACVPLWQVVQVVPVLNPL